MNITLKAMDLETALLFYRDFTYDPATFSNGLPAKPFPYSSAWVDTYCKKQTSLARIHLAIMEDDMPVGEILFKELDYHTASCVYSIHLQNDAESRHRNYGNDTSASICTRRFENRNCFC